MKLLSSLIASGLLVFMSPAAFACKQTALGSYLSTAKAVLDHLYDEFPLAKQQTLNLKALYEDADLTIVELTNFETKECIAYGYTTKSDVSCKIRVQKSKKQLSCKQN
jgi:hypothetical protein